MNSTAIFIAIFVPVFIAVFLPLFLVGKRSAASQEKARERRLNEAKMNARLLKFNL